MNDFELLRRFQDGDDDAFGGLVRRHVGAVYSTARRVLQNPHLAQDVSQETFCLLARKARHLSADTVLIAWLHRVAWNIAMTTLRSEQRRREREQMASMTIANDSDEASIWNQIEPILDEGIERLNEQERRVILLKFFDGEKSRDIGAVLGISEEAARARVSRAVEKLRVFLRNRGVAISTLNLIGLFLANKVEAVPASTVSAILERLRGVTPMRGPLFFLVLFGSVLNWGSAISKLVHLFFALTLVSALYFAGIAYRARRTGFQAAAGEAKVSEPTISGRLKAIRTNSKLPSAIYDREQREVAWLVEFFKKALVSSPVVQNIQFTRQAFDLGDEYSIIERFRDSAPFKLQSYEGAKSGDRFRLTQIQPSRVVDLTTEAKRELFREIQSLIDRAGGATNEIRSAPSFDDFVAAKGGSKSFGPSLLSDPKFLNQTLHMGIANLDSGTVVWRGNEFIGTCFDVPIYGELELRSGLPYRVTVKDKKDEHPNYILEYGYPHPATLLGGYPASIILYRKIGEILKPAGCLEIKECKISVAPLEEDYESSQFMTTAIPRTSTPYKPLIDYINGTTTMDTYLPIKNPSAPLHFRVSP